MKYATLFAVLAASSVARAMVAQPLTADSRSEYPAFGRGRLPAAYFRTVDNADSGAGPAFLGASAATATATAADRVQPGFGGFASAGGNSDHYNPAADAALAAGFPRYGRGYLLPQGPAAAEAATASAGFDAFPNTRPAAPFAFASDGAVDVAADSPSIPVRNVLPKKSAAAAADLQLASTPETFSSGTAAADTTLPREIPGFQQDANSIADVGATSASALPRDLARQLTDGNLRQTAGDVSSASPSSSVACDHAGACDCPSASTAADAAAPTGEQAAVDPVGEPTLSAVDPTLSAAECGECAAKKFARPRKDAQDVAAAVPEVGKFTDSSEDATPTVATGGGDCAECAAGSSCSSGKNGDDVVAQSLPERDAVPYVPVLTAGRRDDATPDELPVNDGQTAGTPKKCNKCAIKHGAQPDVAEVVPELEAQDVTPDETLPPALGRENDSAPDFAPTVATTGAPCRKCAMKHARPSSSANGDPAVAELLPESDAPQDITPVVASTFDPSAGVPQGECGKCAAKKRMKNNDNNVDNSSSVPVGTAIAELLPELDSSPADSTSPSTFSDEPAVSQDRAPDVSDCAQNESGSPAAAGLLPEVDSQNPTAPAVATRPEEDFPGFPVAQGATTTVKECRKCRNKGGAPEIGGPQTAEVFPELGYQEDPAPRAESTDPAADIFDSAAPVEPRVAQKTPCAVCVAKHRQPAVDPTRPAAEEEVAPLNDPTVAESAPRRDSPISFTPVVATSKCHKCERKHAGAPAVNTAPDESRDVFDPSVAEVAPVDPTTPSEQDIAPVNDPTVADVEPRRDSPTVFTPVAATGKCHKCERKHAGAGSPAVDRVPTTTDDSVPDSFDASPTTAEATTPQSAPAHKCHKCEMKKAGLNPSVAESSPFPAEEEDAGVAALNPSPESDDPAAAAEETSPFPAVAAEEAMVPKQFIQDPTAPEVATGGGCSPGCNCAGCIARKLKKKKNRVSVVSSATDPEAGAFVRMVPAAADPRLAGCGPNESRRRCAARKAFQKKPCST